jgi:hypothetical protein
MRSPAAALRLEARPESSWRELLVTPKLAPAATGTYDLCVRRLSVLPIVLLAACGPRAVLGHGTSPTASTADTNPVPPVPRPTWGPPGAVDSYDLLKTNDRVVYDDRDATGDRAPHAHGITTVRAPAIAEVSAGAVALPTSDLATDDLMARDKSGRDHLSGVVLSRLPAPHRVAANEARAPRTVEDAFALVGHRDSRESLAFAIAIAKSLGETVSLGRIPAVADGSALVAWARELGAWSAPASMTRPGGEARTGDLLVFDRAAAKAPASLVGVVLATDDRGVIAFLYLARGVIRVGHVDPTRPRIARDREGRTVNSYIRHTTDHPPAGTRYLAGELLAGRVRL